MRIYKHKSDINAEIESLKALKKTIGFVPTMGCLHDGHIALVKTSLKENDVTVVSIFVNPTQFNNPEDLQKYPRTPEADIEKLKAVNCDIVFMPLVNEIYPEPDNRKFNFSYLENIMEGKFRKDHFNGVAQVVSKLFNIVRPDIAYFGQKDYQQLVVIKDLVRQMNMDIRICSCPIVREKNGLAMSSRNERLSTEQRENASIIFKTMKEFITLAPQHPLKEIKEIIINRINENKNAEVEYFEFANADDLTIMDEYGGSENIIGCIAVYFCGVRLIDNIIFNI